MTDQNTQPVDPNIGDRFVNTSYVKDGQAPPARKPFVRPTPGLYFLKAGNVSVTFVPEKSSGPDAERPWSFPARFDVQPNFSIVSGPDGEDEFAGKMLNEYYRLSTEPVKRGKVELNYSTLSSCLDAFGLEFPLSGAEADIRQVCSDLSGMTSLRPIYVTYQGQFKYKPFVQLPDGSYLRFNEKAFRTGDTKVSVAKYKAAGGTWARSGFLLDPDDQTLRAWTLDKPSENVAQKEIYANIEPSEGGFRAND